MPTNPTAAAGLLQFGAAKPWPRAPGAIRKMLPEPVLTQVFGAPPGTRTASGWLALSPEATALNMFCASRAGSVLFTSCAWFKCNPRDRW